MKTMKVMKRSIDKTSKHFTTKATKEHEEENTKNDFDFDCDTDSEFEERVCVLPTPE